MVISCWSVKGGVGVTVVVAAVGSALAAPRQGPGALLIDLGGDLPAAFARSPGSQPGLSDWLSAGVAVPPDALSRLEFQVGPRLSLLPRGRGALDQKRIAVLCALVAADPRHVVVDAGNLRADPVARELVARSDRSVLVVRACPFARSSLVDLPARPDAVVVVRPAGGAVTWQEIEAWCGAPVVAEVAHDPSIARAVASGLHRRSLPRPLLLAVRPIGAVA